MSGSRRQPGPAAQDENAAQEVEYAAQDVDYERAGLDGHLAPGNSPALLLVDPARAYADPDCPLYAGSNRPWTP
ncbi:hypothetical protein [Streptomyces sp. NPDC055013]